MQEYLSLIPQQGLILPLMLIFALILDWLIGDMRWFFTVVPHPVVIIGKLISFLEKKLNRESRGKNTQMIRGMVVVFFVVGLAVLTGWFLQILFASFPYGWALEILLTAILLAGRSLFSHVGAVAKGLKDKGLEGGREAVSHIVGRDPKSLDQYGVARSAIESLSENFADGVVAPAFYYLLFGLPGIIGYKAINTLDSMIGYRTKRFKRFGMVAARLDDLANWLPARISGTLIVIASIFSPYGNPAKAVNIMIKHSPKHASPNAGWPEGAMAGALDFALGGPRKYPGGVKEAAWIGSGRARLGPTDIRAAQMLYLLANLVMSIFIVLIAAVYF